MSVVGRDAELAVAAGLRRRDLRRSGCARARGRGGHGEDDALAARGRERRGGRAPRASGRARRERDRAQLLRASAICSTRCSTRRSRRCRRVSGARSSRALVLEDDEGPPPDPHAVGVALLNALRALAEAGPLLVAVDDVQWLDAASRGALAYAVRRLRERARRRPARAPLGPRERAARRAPALAPASAVATSTSARSTSRRCTSVVQSAPRGRASAAAARRSAQASGGNPFYALEIVRMLDDGHLGRGRSAAARARVAPRPRPRAPARPAAESRDFLLAAAAHAHPTISITEAASGVDCARGWLRRSRRASSSSTASGSASRTRCSPRARTRRPIPLRRAEIHARLAELLEDPEARAWQLAASVDEPDEAVAAGRSRSAARHARARGAPRPAALLLDRASELTPPDRPDDARATGRGRRVPALRVGGLAAGRGAAPRRHRSRSLRAATRESAGACSRASARTRRQPRRRALPPGDRRGRGRPRDARRRARGCRHVPVSGSASGSTRPSSTRNSPLRWRSSSATRRWLRRRSWLAAAAPRRCSAARPRAATAARALALQTPPRNACACSTQPLVSLAEYWGGRTRSSGRVDALVESAAARARARRRELALRTLLVPSRPGRLRAR